MSTKNRAPEKGSWALVHAANEHVPDISVPELAALLEDPDWLVVDTRAASELIKLGKIKGAVHAPRQSIEFHVDPEMEVEGKYIPELNEGKKMALYCKTGRRSVLACRTLQLMGYDNVYNLAGGYDEWQREELPVEQVEATKFP